MLYRERKKRMPGTQKRWLLLTVFYTSLFFSYKSNLVYAEQEKEPEQEKGFFQHISAFKEQIIEITTNTTKQLLLTDLFTWQLLHPVRPYGRSTGTVNGAAHFHAPGQYCPVCQRFVGMSEAPPPLDHFKPDLVINGSLRIRGELYRHFNPDKKAAPDVGFNENRVENLLRFNMSGAVNERTLAYIEGQWEYLWGQDNESTDTQLALYQGFMMFNRMFGLPFDMTVGRQELVYGSAYILGANAFGKGGTFDVIKLDYSSGSFFRADFIAGKLAEVTEDDNGIDKDLFGIYTTTLITDGLLADFYWFVERDEKDAFGKKIANNSQGVPATRYLLGSRFLINPTPDISLEFEPVMEFGRSFNGTRLKSDRIASYGGHFDIAGKLHGTWHPALLFSYAIASGDLDDTDNRLREFQGTTFHDSYIFGEMRIVGGADGSNLGTSRFSGIRVASFGCQLDFSERWNLNVDAHNYTAQRAPEGISTRIGNETNVILSFMMPDGFNVQFSVNQFYPEKGYKQALKSSNIVHYFYVQTNVYF